MGGDLSSEAPRNRLEGRRLVRWRLVRRQERLEGRALKGTDRRCGWWWDPVGTPDEGDAGVEFPWCTPLERIALGRESADRFAEN